MHVVPQRHRSKRDHAELSRVEELSTAVGDALLTVLWSFKQLLLDP